MFSEIYPYKFTNFLQSSTVSKRYRYFRYNIFQNTLVLAWRKVYVKQTKLKNVMIRNTLVEMFDDLCDRKYLRLNNVKTLVSITECLCAMKCLSWIVCLFVCLVCDQPEIFSVESAASDITFPVEVTGGQSVDQTSSSRYIIHLVTHSLTLVRCRRCHRPGILYTWSLCHSL